MPSDQAPRTKVIACGVFERELRHLAEQGLPFETELLDAGLHSAPLELNRTLQASIDATGPEFDRLAILYGVCGRAAVGLAARAVPLVIPRVHDCIALFLGDAERYRREFRSCPGTIYFTPGWCEKEAHPDRHRLEASRDEWTVKDHQNYPEWAARYGEGNADMIVEFLGSWRANYQRVAFINNGLGDIETYRRQAHELADAAGWKFQEMEGTFDFIVDLLAPELDEKRFLVVPPEHRVVATHDARLLSAVPDRSGEVAVTDVELGRFTVGGEGGTERSGGGIGLGVDAGGTYTDAVLVELDGGRVLSKAKFPTRPQDLLASIDGAVSRLDASLFPAVRLIALSTTLATNAIVEGRGAQVGLLLMPANESDVERLNARPLRVVPGRLTIDGDELEPIDPDSVRQAVRELVAEGCEALAISGYGSVHNTAHELAVRDAALDVAELPVICGHELTGRLDFVRRAHTAVLNARLLPTIGELLDAVGAGLQRLGIEAATFVVRGDGSLISVDAARQRPIDTLLSGPAASAGGARFLTGSDELLAVDIGGTTTDIAIVAGGRVAVCPEGPTVGAWRTSVAAVDILTSGLGGDSQVRVVEGGLKVVVGPGRVTPLCHLASRFELVTEELQEVAERAEREPERVAPSAIEFFELLGLRERLKLTDRELALVDVLSRGPASRAALARATRALSPELLATSRLEELGVLRRAALTPTDVLHVLGRLDLYDRRAAEAALRAVAHVFHREPDSLAADIERAVTQQLAYQILRRELSVTLGDPEAEHNQLLDRMLAELLSDPDRGGPYRLRFDEHRTVVGIGAPAGELLPAAGRLLNARVVVPAHAEVANAIGAVTGKVMVRTTVSIRPDGAGNYLLLSPLARGEFADLADARERATELVVEHLQARAAEFGTDERQVTVDVFDRTGRLDDGSLQLIELVVEGLLEGSPRLREAAD